MEHKQVETFPLFLDALLGPQKATVADLESSEDEQKQAEQEEERTKKTADFSLLNFFLQKSFRQKFKFHHTHYY